MIPRRAWLAALLAMLVALTLTAAVPDPAAAEEGVSWRLEQPTPEGSPLPLALGHVGDIEFFAPNRGLLITAGDEPAVPMGVWAYNGVRWHELADKCGASDGRIAWAGPEEFWTVSDGRAGQTGEGEGSLERQAPLQDNTLCHFAGGAIVGSYAHPAFQADSYQAMHAAACIGPADCWFAGDPLPEPQIGAFHLHWTGTALEAEPYPEEGHAVEDMVPYEGRIEESVRVALGDRVAVESPRVPVLHLVNPAGVLPVFEPEEQLPIYEPNELARALDFLHLSADGEDLWAAAGAQQHPGPGEVTLALREGGVWRQLIGPQHPLGAVLPPSQSSEELQILGGEARHANVAAIAADPGTGSAWLALASPTPHNSPGGTPEPERALLVHIASDGHVLEADALPSDGEQEEGIGPKGAPSRLICPAASDCWLATTEGWLFHLAPEGERTLAKDEDANFAGLITYRPPDQGLAQIPPDAPPPDTSGLVEAPPNYGEVQKEATGTAAQAKVTLPLLSHMHSRLVKGSTLELRFHLAVKARVRLLAQRRRKVVASTPMRTFAAGNRSLRLRLDPRRWPTKLSLQTHALAPLPEVSSVTGEGANIGTVTTSLHVLPGDAFGGGPGFLR